MDCCTGVPLNANRNSGEMQRFKDDGPVQKSLGINRPEKEVKRYDVSIDKAINKRGLAIIMTNDFQCSAKIRPVPFVWRDGGMLRNLFRSLQFDVIWRANHSSDDMERSLVQDIGNADKRYKMFVCCISTHGGDGFVLGQDGEKVLIETIIDKVVSRNHEDVFEKFKGKPKLFFFNTCQGQKLQKAEPADDEVDMAMFDVKQDYLKIAQHADLLLGYATYQNNRAYGCTEGSYYIDQLVKYLKQYHADYDIHTILAAVCYGVQSIQMNISKKPSALSQLPMVLSTLRKELIIPNDD